jgi:GDP-mannose transporter
MNFLLLTIQSIVCVACVSVVKSAGVISFRAFDMQDAKTWFPISLLLVSVIYTGSKSLVRHPFLNYQCGIITLLLVAISKYTNIHDIQESDNHPNCMYFLVEYSFSDAPRRLKAYGEVIWFDGRVTGLTFVSFVFMVSYVNKIAPLFLLIYL